MDNRTRTIKSWQKNPNMSLEDMYNKALEKGWTNYNVETQIFLREYCVDMIRKDFAVAPLLKSIEDNIHADYFKFDVTGWSNTPAKPIYNKDDLAEALI